MFSDAYGLVRRFTRPVVLSHPDSGSVPLCGTLIAVNRSGWMLTAKHVLAGSGGMEPGSLGERLMLGWPGLGVEDLIVDSKSDLALAKVGPFDSELTNEYPSFPREGGVEAGMSVGRLGFAPESAGSGFESAGILFNEGIVSRIYQKEGVKYFITSSPGIKGQSGGPVFDRDGTIVGIQTSTRSAEIGYTMITDSGSAAGLKSNEGIAIHVETVRDFLDAAGVSYRLV